MARASRVAGGLFVFWVVGACGARSGLTDEDLASDASRPEDTALPPTPLPPCADYDGPLTLVSVTPDGSPSGGGAGSPTISRDGRLVAYVSSAGDLVSGDTNDELDVFVFDRAAGRTVRASVASDGTEGEDASGFRLITGRPTLSGDGTLVAFPSNADRLHPDDDNGRTDVYVHSLVTRETRFVRFPDDRFVGGDAPALSRDGRFLAFAMLNLAWAMDDEIAAFQIVRVDLASGEGEHVSIDDDERLGDEFDDFLGSGVDLTERVISISADGRFVTFASGSNNLEADEDTHPDVFIRDMKRGTLFELTEAADDGCYGPSLSADGRFVAFNSGATTYPNPDTTVYVQDRETGFIEAVPEAAGYPILSEDGRYVTFVRDRLVYVYDRRTGERAALAPTGLDDDEIQTRPFLGGDGCWATFLWSRGVETQVWVARNPLR